VPRPDQLENNKRDQHQNDALLKVPGQEIKSDAVQ